MMNTMTKIALGGLIAAGVMAFGQNPATPAQPGQPAQAQPQTPAAGESQAAKGQSASQGANAEEVFAALDANHDGKLSADEFGKLFRNAKEADVSTEFARWDKNGDKSLTMEEFKANYPQH